MCKSGDTWSRDRAAGCRLGSDSNPEHALTQLKAEQSTIGDAQVGTGRFGKVAG